MPIHEDTGSSANGRRSHVLVLCDYDPFNARMIQDHIHALARGSRHDVRVLSFRGELPEALDLARFDAIVVHYTAFIHDDDYLAPSARARLRAARAAKAVFLHDEYKHVDRTKDALAAVGANALFTCFEPEAARRVYDDPRLRDLMLVPVLPGYVPRDLARLDPGPPPARRPIDIGYRGRRYPVWHGRLGRDRVTICEAIREAAPRWGWSIDVSVDEKDRIYGDAWLAFQKRCKAILGTESGSSVVDFTGGIAAEVEAHKARDPRVDDATLHRLYVAPHEDVVPLATISPRLFEAIACGAALVLYDGGYAGRLRPWRHYLPLRRDHANIDAIAAALADGDRLSEMIRAAREEVLLAPENAETTLVTIFDDTLSTITADRPAAPGHDAQAFDRAFGRYDRTWRLDVAARLATSVALRIYAELSRLLPLAVVAPVDRRVRLLWRRLRGKGAPR